LQNLEASIDLAFGLHAGYGVLCQAPVAPCPLGDSIGELVRLTFHDAVGGGYSNGCLDFSQPGHGGLFTTVEKLNTAWAPFSGSGISFADCIVIAGARAIHHASSVASLGTGRNFEPEHIGSQTLELPTRIGRVDALTCNDNDELPHAADTWADMKSIFTSKFNMTSHDIVAIMGAHTLGRAELANSGHEGKWTNYQSSMSNMFYVNMVLGDWRRDCNRSPDPTPESCIQMQWVEPKPYMALDIDVELVISPQIQCNHFGPATPSSAGPISVGVNNTCPRNIDTIDKLQSYVSTGGTARWWVDFASAWRKMTESGHHGLFTPV
jgi:hypothetical protein